MRYTLEQSLKAKEALIKFWGHTENEFFPAEEQEFIKGEPLLYYPYKEYPSAHIQSAYILYEHLVDITESEIKRTLGEKVFENPKYYTVELFTEGKIKNSFKKATQIEIKDKDDIKSILELEIISYPRYFDAKSKKMKDKSIGDYYTFYFGYENKTKGIINISNLQHREENFEELDAEIEFVALMKKVLRKYKIDLEQYKGINLKIPIPITFSSKNSLVFSY